MKPKSDLLQGTLDLLILRTLAAGDMHGWGIAQRLQQISQDVLQVNQGSLYPALYRLEQQGWIEAGVGRLREQPARQVLPADQVGPQAAGRGNGELGAHHRRGRARAAAGLNERHVARLAASPAPRFVPHDAFEDSMEAELRHHLELETEALVARGMSAGEARDARAPPLRQRRAGQGRLPRLVGPARDRCMLGRTCATRCAALRSIPAYTAVVLLTLALGIGAEHRDLQRRPRRAAAAAALRARRSPGRAPPAGRPSLASPTSACR